MTAFFTKRKEWIARGKWLYLAGAVLALTGADAEAGQEAIKTKQFDEIVVTGEKITTPTRETGETVYTGTEITARGIAAQGTPASTNVYEAINLLPGVFVESIDPYGLGAESGGVRVRGVSGSMGAMTVEGIPNYGLAGIGPREYIYDTENLRSISVYKGAIPADIGIGVGSRGGAIDLKPRWPEKEMGFKASQSVGTNHYQRTQLRFDSGALTAFDTRFSGAYSYSDADKWKGAGKVGPRNNVNLAFSQPFGSLVDVKLWFNYNQVKQNSYRSISYAQYQNLDANYRFDYNETLTGNAAADVNYYDYNRGSYTNKDVMGLIAITPADKLRLTLKPFISWEDTEVFGASGAQIQKQVRDTERRGIVAEADWDAGFARAVVGYLFEDARMDIHTEKYAVTAGGLDYRGYGMIALPDSGHAYYHSPYLKLSGARARVDWQLGLKYFRFEDAASIGYASTAAAPYPLVRTPDLDREGRTYDIVLPTAGLGYRFSDNLNFYASYGRSFVRPYAYQPLISTYLQNKAKFVAAGVTLNDLFKGYDMEKADNVELGVRFKKERFDIAPTVFFGKHKNLLTNVYDPAVDATYRQNIANATGYGIDLESNFYLTRDVTVFINPTWTSLTYDDDMTFKTYTLHAKNNQVVDTPELMVKAGVICKWGDFEIIPSANWIGERYSDSQNLEKVSSHVVVNLLTSYTLRKIPLADKVKLSLQLQNIFDKQYISAISASDDALQGAASYKVGAPFSAVLSASVEF